MDCRAGRRAAVGAIVPIYKSSDPTVGMETYDLLPVIPLPQLLVGYECDVGGG